MYFDEVLWQKKRRIQNERNKEISVLKTEFKSLSCIIREMKQELDVFTVAVNAQQALEREEKNATMMIYEIERLLLSSKVMAKQVVISL
jgi:hypothetical protein